MTGHRRIRLPGPVLTALLVALTVGTTIAHAGTAGGGLSVLPATIEHTAAPGVVGSIALANTTASAQKITIVPRPWIASSGGQVNPDLHKDLSQYVTVSKSSLTLPAGASQSVSVMLKKVPPGGSLFGSLVVVGIPVDASKRPGISIGYRLITRLRLDPAQNARKLKVTVGNPRVVGKNIVLPVRNTGNTIEPIGGLGAVTGALGTRNISIAEQRIVPGASALMVVTPTKGLKHGRYTVNYALVQTTTRVAAGKKSIQIG